MGSIKDLLHPQGSQLGLENLSLVIKIMFILIFILLQIFHFFRN